MKKKIVGIFVCMLLIMTAIVSATTVKEENIGTTSYEVDVPVWKVGDSWTYNERYSQFGYQNDGTLGFVWYHNCTSTYTVTDDSGDNYTVKLTSKNNTGWFIFGPYRLRFTPFTKLTQEIQFRKTDLGHVHILNREKGPVIWLIGKIGFPFPAYYIDVWESFETPAHVYLPFPLTAGTNGTLPSFTATGHEKMSLYWGLIKFIDSDFSFNFPAVNYTCEMASITVPAGIYDAYNVSTDVYFNSAHNYTRTYYVPEVGYYVKRSSNYEQAATGKPTDIYEHELVSTTYTQ